MQDLTSSLLLLLIAIVLLWLAVTDKLGRVLDAWDVISGKSTVSSPGVSTNAGALKPVVFLPSLPPLGQNVQVGIS